MKRVQMEDIGQSYLFKLRQSAGVERLVERQWSREGWREVGAGFQGVQTELKLSGWSCARRVVVLRRAVKDSLIAKYADTHSGEQQVLHFADLADAKLWQYAVLITNTDYALESIAQLYRDRADCENGFDELKNQWGWGGYTTHDLERCNLSARAVALIYNWWCADHQSLRRRAPGKDHFEVEADLSTPFVADLRRHAESLTLPSGP